MAGLVEKTYGDALFELFLEEDPSKLTEAKEELSAVNSVISELPELIKLSKTPTIEKEEKLGIIKEAFEGRLSEYIFNFLMVLTEAGRLEYFDKVTEYFRERCNEYLGIADITVVTCQPLTAKAKADLSSWLYILQKTGHNGKTKTRCLMEPKRKAEKKYIRQS